MSHALTSAACELSLAFVHRSHPPDHERFRKVAQMWDHTAAAVLKPCLPCNDSAGHTKCTSCCSIGFFTALSTAVLVPRAGQVLTSNSQGRILLSNSTSKPKSSKQALRFGAWHLICTAQCGRTRTIKGPHVRMERTEWMSCEPRIAAHSADACHVGHQQKRKKNQLLPEQKRTAKLISGSAARSVLATKSCSACHRA